MLDRLSADWSCDFSSGKAPYETARCRMHSDPVLLVKPMTFMNRSGMALAHVLQRHPADLERVLVVCDDFALPLGKLRFRARGSDGGHNGLASVIDKLGTREFPRLRMGIGLDPGKETAEYVLSRFRKTEKEAVDSMIDRACEAVADFIQHGIHHAMNRWNRSS